MRDRHIDVSKSALTLLSYQVGDSIDLVHDRHYELLADTQFIRTADARRASYDFLIFSG
jgi:hypothetical protein